MQQAPRDTLVKLIQQHGPELADDQRRLEGLLRDYAGDYRREISVLVGAAREGIPQELRDPHVSVPAALRRGRLVQRLQDNLALSRDAAEWAVDTWAEALDVSVGPTAPELVYAAPPTRPEPPPQTPPANATPSDEHRRSATPYSPGAQKGNRQLWLAGAIGAGAVAAVGAGALVIMSVINPPRPPSPTAGPVSGPTRPPVAGVASPVVIGSPSPNTSLTQVAIANASATTVARATAVAQATVVARASAVAQASVVAQASLTAIQAKARAPASWKLVDSGPVSTKVNLTPSSDDLRDQTLKAANGKLTLSAKSKKPYTEWFTFKADPGAVFHLSVDVKQVDGDADTYYGLAAHGVYSPNKYYMFAANDARYFFIDRRISPDWSTLVARSVGAATRAGETNTLALRAEGTHYTFFVNDRFVTETNDGGLSGGSTGFVVRMDKPDGKLTLEFGNFEVRAP